MIPIDSNVHFCTKVFIHSVVFRECHPNCMSFRPPKPGSLH